MSSNKQVRSQIMEVLDDNSKHIPEGVYLELCNLLQKFQFENKVDSDKIFNTLAMLQVLGDRGMTAREAGSIVRDTREEEIRIARRENLQEYSDDEVETEQRVINVESDESEGDERPRERRVNREQNAVQVINVTANRSRYVTNPETGRRVLRNGRIGRMLARQ